MRRYFISKEIKSNTFYYYENKCIFCNKVLNLDEDEYFTITQNGKKKIVCIDCMKAKGMEICEQCKEAIIKNEQNEYRDKNNDIFYLCDKCKELYHNCYFCDSCMKDNIQYLEDDDIWICSDCAETHVRCDECNKFTDEADLHYVQCEDRYLCDSCIEDYTECENCNEYFPQDDCYETYDNHGYRIHVCEACLEEYQTTCNSCGTTLDIYSDDIYYFDDLSWCQSCYSQQLGVCQACDETFYINDLQYDEQEGVYYCSNCYKVDPQEGFDNSEIRNYGVKIVPGLKSMDNQQETNQYIGAQLEIRNEDDDRSIVQDFAAEVAKKNKYLIFKDDGSIGNGCEIVTKACTYKFHRHQFGWQRIFDLMKKYKMSNTDSCGLHFHISRNNFNFDQLKCLDYFVNNCTKYLSEVGGRDYTDPEQGRFCRQRDKTQNQYGNNLYDRYQAVNFKNSNTVQLRFFKSTNSMSDFIKRLSVVHNICKLSKFFTFDDLKVLDQTDLKYCFHEIIKNIY